MRAAQASPDTPSEDFAGGFVFYPREYHINDAEPFSSYATGVLADGTPVSVQIRPPEDALASAQADKGKVIPNFSLFSQTGRRARFPCEATPENGRTNPAGILLIEQAEPIDRARGIWSGKWASILRYTREDPRPVIGTGYLEMALSAPAENIERIRALSSQYQQTLAAKKNGRVTPIDAEQQLSALMPEIYGLHRHWFAAVILLNVYSVAQISRDAIYQACRWILEQPVPPGLYRGAIIRIRSGDRVQRNAVFQVDMGYDYKNRRIKTFDEVFAPFVRYQLPKLIAAYGQTHAPEVEVVSLLRINFGPKGNEHYSKLLTDWSRGKPKILKAYVDGEFHDDFTFGFKRSAAFLASRVAVRIFEIQSGASRGNNIASVVHSFSPVIGHACAIDPSRRRAYRISDG